ncbi:PREDICTED: uncharacterized protein LOC105118689 [Populus euphratica]|uniref:Uncharacterized protein LOC105118689 n=1 Tax=Populus euphratica TaxID=75702 RepID=A0AAJ6XDL4_POPEU|nr:PREDICTED: uncharacterized protein LOC105118689 [Populus euphratica]
MVENETDLSIKCLRTNRGGEFTSLEFNKFCEQHGIKRQLATTYTPQQNGVAKRKNRIVMNMVHAMLYEKKVPRTLWTEAVNWSNYVLNRCPTLMVKNITLAEAWNGIKPFVEHFRVFGCIAHVHVPEGDSDEEGVDDVNNNDTEHQDNYSEDNEGNASIEQREIEANEGDVCTNNRDNEDNKEGTRMRNPPTWMKDYVTGESLGSSEDEDLALIMSSDPLHFKEAVTDANWRSAMDKEIKSIEKNKTWTLVHYPLKSRKLG